MIKVAFTDFVFEDRQAIKLEGCEFSIHGPLKTSDEIVSAAQGAEVLCMRDQFGKVTAEVFERLPELKFVVTRSVGYDHIDLEEAKARRIPVCNVPDYGAHMIAEHVFGLLLAVARNVVRGDRRYKKDQVFSDKGFQGIELRGKTIGVLGTGRIGMNCIQIAKGFGMNVLAYDINENQETASKLGFRYASLDEVLASSDVISVHVTLNDATHHLINAKNLEKMKKGVILINTSRGDVINTQALMNALHSGHVFGAGLDVLEDERNVYYDFSDLNVVVTPHLGWYTDGAVKRILSISLENIFAYMRGELINRLV